MPRAGEDRDELLARVARLGFDELLGASQPSIEFVLTRELGRVGPNASAEARARVVHSVAGVGNAGPDPPTRDIHVHNNPLKLAIPPTAVPPVPCGQPTPFV